MHINSLILNIVILILFNNNLLAQEESFSINELIGKTAPKNSNNTYKLRGEVYECFSKMKKAALEDSIKLKVVSAYRSYDHQQRIWNRKFKRFKSYGMSDSLAVNKILEYSTIPGTSRHHWGTDLDIVMETNQKVSKLLITSNFDNNGPFYKLKKWMDANAEKFGFKLIYTNDPNRKGFKYEPWHYTFHATANKMLDSYIEQKCITKIDLHKNLGSPTISKKKLNEYLNKNIITR